MLFYCFTSRISSKVCKILLEIINVNVIKVMVSIYCSENQQMPVDAETNLLGKITVLWS